MLCALSFFALLFSIGCGGGGGSSSDGVAAIATAPIDLPPGQTSALMAWTASEGEVTGYLVFQSNDEEEFEYLTQVTEPEARITGAPGDSIRILVVARGVESLQSVASPPSPPVRFHAAAEAAAAVAVESSEATAPAATALSLSTAASAVEALPQAATTEPIPVDDDSSVTASSATEDLDHNDGPDASDISDDESALADPVLRDRLLRADARFPHADLSPETSRWIQSFVDAEIRAGVSLAGTGEMNRDEFRELVWIDSSGQLFVSDGARIAASEEVSSTLAEAIRLRSTERFAGLADFDGDGIGDWLIEDTATNDVWILDNESHEAIYAHPADENPDLRLVGHGDFDNDGRSELLWQHDDLSFRLGSPADAPADVEWISSGEAPDAVNPTHDKGELLSVVDLNGDGRDDLLFRGLDGLLDLALSVGGPSSSPGFEWISGPEAASDGLELVATLDLDQDGAAEIVWWNQGSIEIWEVQTGL